MTKRFVAVFILAVMLFTLCSCGNAKDSAEERMIRINVSPTAMDQFLLVLMKEEGLFEKYFPEGAQIEYTSMASGSEQRDALVSNQLDFAGLAVLNVATALQNDIPLEYVFYMGSNLYQLYAADENIQTMSDLDSSHKVSVSSIGTGPHTAFLLAAQADGRNVSDFDNSMITMTNSDAITALISGTGGVDAVVSTFPTLLTAWKSDKIHMVRDFSEEIIDYGVGTAMCTSQDFAEKNPDILECMMKAYEEAVDILNNDPEKAEKIMMDVYEGCDAETAEEMIEYYSETVAIGGNKYDKLMTFLYEQGILEQQPIPFDDIPKYEAAK